MKKTFVYDLPMRVFHWLFAILFAVAFAIGTAVDDDSVAFSYHMIAGILLCFLVVLRAVWGMVGTKYSRFSGFSLRPSQLILYVRGILTGDKRKWPGHNPASSWAAIAMMFLALGLGVTGYLMTTGGGSENLEEVHELLANGFLIVVLLHLAGLVLHSARHKDAMSTSMFTGLKTDIPEERIPVRPHRAVGTLLLIATLWFSSYLAQNFDSASRSLSVFGERFNLGEAEDDEDEGEGIEGSHEANGGHDDDETGDD